MTEQENKDWKDEIDKMSHVDMATFLRFAPIGHPIFDSQDDLYDYFQDRFQKLGGWTPEISRLIEE